MGPWFEVIAGGTGDRPPPRSKTAATLNFKHGMARTKNKRNKILKVCYIYPRCSVYETEHFYEIINVIILNN